MLTPRSTKLRHGQSPSYVQPDLSLQVVDPCFFLRRQLRLQLSVIWGCGATSSGLDYFLSGVPDDRWSVYGPREQLRYELVIHHPTNVSRNRRVVLPGCF